MLLILTAVAIQLICGIAALLFRRNLPLPPDSELRVRSSPARLASFPPSRCCPAAPSTPSSASWSMPLGAFSVGLDGLSAFFLFPILGLGALSAIYGLGYLRPYREQQIAGIFMVSVQRA